MIARLRPLMAIADQAVISGATFVLTILIVAATNLSTFGTIAFLLNFALMGQGVVLAAVILPMNTLYAFHRERSADFLGGTLAICLLVSLVIGGAVLALALVFDGHRDIGWLSGLLFYLYFVLNCLQDAARRQLYLQTRTGLSTVVVTIRYGGPLVGLLLAKAMGISIDPMSFWAILCVACLAALAVQAAAAPFAAPSLQVVRRLAQTYRTTGGWLVLQTIIQITADNLLFMFSGSLIPRFDLGVWRSLQTVSGILNPILISLENIIPARVGVRLKEQGAQAASRWLWKMTAAGLIAFSLGAVMISIFARPLVELLFPKVPAGYEWIVQVYAVIQVLMLCKFFVVVRGRLFGGGRALVYLSLLNLILAAALCYPLPKYWGVQGAVYGLVALQAFSLAMAAVFLRSGGARRGTGAGA